MKSMLLPGSYKIVGLIIFILAFLVPILMGIKNPQSWEETESRRQVANAIMLIGLSLVLFSKEKIEDEFISFCRLRAFRVAFIAGIIYFLQDTFGTFNGNILHSSFGLIIMEIGVYLIVFYISKSGLINAK